MRNLSTGICRQGQFQPHEEIRHHRLGLHVVLPQNHLPTRTLALEPPCGWNGKRGQQSLKAYQWLEWHNTQHTAGIIAHAFNGGERTLQVGPRRYQVDRFNETTHTVYKFHGCLWHGCPLCFYGSMDKTTPCVSMAAWIRPPVSTRSHQTGNVRSHATKTAAIASPRLPRNHPLRKSVGPLT